MISQWTRTVAIEEYLWIAMHFDRIKIGLSFLVLSTKLLDSDPGKSMVTAKWTSRFKWISMIQCKVVYDYHLCCMEISCTLHFHKKITLFIHLVSVFVWNLSHFFWTRLLSFVSWLISLLLFAVVLISVKTKCSNDHRHHHYVFVIISYFEYVHFYSRGRSENHVYKYTQTHSHNARTTFILTLWPNFVCLIHWLCISISLEL